MEILLLSIFGLILGFVNAISGGGGIFALPLFLALGLTPVNALALNLISDVGVVFGVMHNYYRSKEISWKFTFAIFPLLILGSIVGAKVIVGLSPTLIKNIILIGVAVGIFFLLKPTKISELQEKFSKTRNLFGYLMLFFVGMWDGSIAIAGTTFALIVMAHMFGKRFIQGRTAYAAASTPGTIIAALILYSESTLSLGWPLIILISNFVGAWIGSHLAIKFGDTIIKRCMIIMSILIVGKLIFSEF